MSSNFSYRISSKAQKDIDELIAYVATVLFNRTAATKILNDLEQAIERVCQFPYASNDCTYYGINDENIRYVIVGNYILVYQIDQDANTIVVIRLIYSHKNITPSNIGSN